MDDAGTQSLDQRDEEHLSGDEIVRLKTVIDVFTRLSIACKSRSLYPSDHPAAIDSVTLMHAVMEDSLETLPVITVQVGKDSLVYEKESLGRNTESMRQLASRIRALNIQEISIKAGITQKEAEMLVELLIQDPEELYNAGGPETFMLVNNLQNVVVVESAAGRSEEEEEEEDLALPEGFVIEGPKEEEEEEEEVAAPEEIENLLKLLLDPEELGGVLMSLTSEDGEPLEAEELADAIFLFLKNAATIVKRDEAPRKQEYFRSIAESLLFLEVEVRNLLLIRQMFPTLRDQPVSSQILNQFSAQEMADVMCHFFPIAPELTPKAGAILKAIGFNEGEMRNALRLLKARLVDLGQVPPFLLENLELSSEKDKTRETAPASLPTLEDITGTLGEYLPEEMEEIMHISEFDPNIDMLEETTPMLLDLIGMGSSLDNLGKAVELLQHNFWSLAMSAKLDLAAKVLECTREILSNPDPALDPYRSDLKLLLEEAASEKVMENMIKLACSRRNDPSAVDELKRYMAGLGEKGIAAMVEALGAEEDMSVRKYILDVLTALGRDRIPLLGKYVNDERWFLVRNIIVILARYHSPEILPYLSQTFHHPNKKVRYETIRALGLTGGYNASEMLIMGLQDEDERTRVLCIRWLGRLEEQRALSRLVSMLDDKEPGAESLTVKKEIVITLGKIGMMDSFDVLKKYQTKQKLLNRAEWQELNQAALESMLLLLEKFPQLERRL